MTANLKYKCKGDGIFQCEEYLRIANHHVFHQTPEIKTERIVVLVCLRSLWSLSVEFRNEAEPSVTPHMQMWGEFSQ